jgi:syringomycin synthetase protein SyrE
MAHTGPISYAQEDPWYVSRLVPDAVPYNEVAVLRRHGALDVAAFRRAFAIVAQRYDAWCTTFPVTAGRPVRRVDAVAAADLEVIDLRGPGGTEAGSPVARAVADIAARPYDLEQGPLLRPVLVQLAETEFVFCLCAHHLVFDCLSVARVAIPELVACYEAVLVGAPIELPEPAATYDEYATWEREWLEGAAGPRRFDYWRVRLAGAVPPVLPADRQRPSAPRFRGGAVPIALPAPLVERMRAAGKAAGGSIFQVLAAGFATLLHGYSGQPEVVFATAADLRRRTKFERMVGFAATWLAIRADFSDSPSFDTLVRRLRVEVLESFDMAIPFGQVVAALHPKRGDGANPLLRVLFVLNPTAELGPDWDLDFTDDRIADAIGATKLDLQVELQEDPTGGVRGRVLFDIDLFDRATIQRLVGDWAALLDRLVDDPTAALPDRGAATAGPADTPSAPASALQSSLVAIWRRVLDVDQVGVHDDFFELGGRSLLAVQMLLEVEQELGVVVPVSDLLDGAVTVAGLAQRIETGPGAAPGVGDVPVFFIWPHEPAMLAVRHLADAFGDTPTVSLVVPDEPGDPTPIGTLAALMVEQIRRRQPQGPYRIAGFSLGGLVGYEVAALLRGAGERLEWLVVLDVPTPAVAKTSFRPAARLARLLDRRPADRWRRLKVASRLTPPALAASQRAAETRAFERRWWAAGLRYVPTAHDTAMELFVAHDTAWRYRSADLGWPALHAGPVTVHVVPGDHDTLLVPPHVGLIGERLAERLGAGLRSV